MGWRFSARFIITGLALKGLMVQIVLCVCSGKVLNGYVIFI